MCALLWVHLKRAQFSITATAHFGSRWEQTISQASGIFQHASSSYGSHGPFSSMIYLWEMDIFIYFPVRYVQLPERMRIIKVTNQFSYGAPHSYPRSLLKFFLYSHPFMGGFPTHSASCRNPPSHHFFPISGGGDRSLPTTRWVLYKLATQQPVVGRKPRRKRQTLTARSLDPYPLYHGSSWRSKKHDSKKFIL
jgi:hypothetical protein